MKQRIKKIQEEENKEREHQKQIPSPLDPAGSHAFSFFIKIKLVPQYSRVRLWECVKVHSPTTHQLEVDRHGGGNVRGGEKLTFAHFHGLGRQNGAVVMWKSWALFPGFPRDCGNLKKSNISAMYFHGRLDRREGQNISTPKIDFFRFP